MSTLHRLTRSFARVCAKTRVSCSNEIRRRREAREAREAEEKAKKEEEDRRVRFCACMPSRQLDHWLSVDSNCPCGCVQYGQFVVHAYVQRKLAKERLAKAMAAPEEDREWIKDVNEHASNAESLKVKVMNEKRPDVLSFRSVPREEINLRSQRRACARG